MRGIGKIKLENNENNKVVTVYRMLITSRTLLQDLTTISLFHSLTLAIVQ